MRRTLGKTGLWDFFDGRIFSASEVERGKPEPDLFLYAAAQVGRLPARCVVVEYSRPRDHLYVTPAGCGLAAAVLTVDTGAREHPESAWPPQDSRARAR